MAKVPNKVAAPAATAPAEAPEARVTSGLMDPVDALVSIVRNALAYMDRVVLAYFTDPASFAALTESERCGVFNVAMSAAGVGFTMPKRKHGAQSRNVWDATVEAAGLRQAAGRDLSPIYWVHQSYAPLAMPGQEARVSPLDVFLSMLAAKRIDTRAIPATCRKWDKDTRSEIPEAPVKDDTDRFAATVALAVKRGALRSALVRGGYRLALPVRPGENSNASGKSASRTLLTGDALSQYLD